MTTTAASPPLSGGRRTAIRVVLVCVAAVLLLVGTAALGTATWALSTVRVLTETQALPTTMRTLAIDTADIPTAIRITTDRAATEPRIDLRMVNSTAAGKQRLTVGNEAGGTRVTLSGESSSLLPWARAAQLTVVLPPDVAGGLSISTKQRTGLLTVEANLDQLVVRTTNGAVNLDGNARRTDVSIRRGDITTRNPISVRESFSANTVEGDIDVRFKDVVPRTVEAISVDGDVTVELPTPGPYRVRAESEGRHGETTVTVPETSDPSAPMVTVRSESGDVTVAGLR